MSNAMDKARADAEAREEKLRARDAEAIQALVAPTEELSALYGPIAMKMRSQAGRVAMDKAVNAFRTAVGALESMGDGDQA